MRILMQKLSAVEAVQRSKWGLNELTTIWPIQTHVELKVADSTCAPLQPLFENFALEAPAFK